MGKDEDMYQGTLKAPTPARQKYVPADKRRILFSQDLLQGETEITIIHEDAEYRLRKTSQNKLILTK